MTRSLVRSLVLTTCPLLRSEASHSVSALCSSIVGIAPLGSKVGRTLTNRSSTHCTPIFGRAGPSGRPRHTNVRSCPSCGRVGSTLPSRDYGKLESGAKALEKSDVAVLQRL